MSWLQRYQIRHYFSNSIWILPLLSILVALAVVPLLHQLDQSLDWESGINPETVRTVLEMMASSMFTFIVFVCSALLIALQLASAQVTPRIIAIVFRDPVTKLSLTIFVFAFTFSQAVLVRINTDVPTLSARLAAYSCIACLGVFLFLIDHVGKWLRPSGALRAVALLGRDVIEIRHFGGASIQVVRRLRALLENLIQTLPEQRVPRLRQELSLLQRTAERCFPEPEDRALAEVSDLQGVGSKCGHGPERGKPSEARSPVLILPEINRANTATE